MKYLPIYVNENTELQTRVTAGLCRAEYCRVFLHESLGAFCLRPRMVRSELPVCFVVSVCTREEQRGRRLENY